MRGPATDMSTSSPYSLESLIRAIASPESSSIDKDVLKEALNGTSDVHDVVAMQSRAKKELEKEFLSPVKDLEGPDLWMWQTLVLSTFSGPHLTGYKLT